LPDQLDLVVEGRSLDALQVNQTRRCPHDAPVDLGNSALIDRRIQTVP